jgi:hypothetical protein
MTNIKLLYAINRNLYDGLININKLNDCENKNCWKHIIEDLMKDVCEVIKIENQTK